MSLLNGDQVGTSGQAILGTSSTPSLAVGSAATGATTSITGTNISGKITVTTAASLLSSGPVLTLTLANGYAFPNNANVTFSAGNSAFASLAADLYISATTASTITLSVAIGLSISTTYIGYYQISGY